MTWLELAKSAIELIRGGHKPPTKEELVAEFSKIARSEAEALHLALAMQDMTSAASNVLTAFRTRPQGVPVLNLDIEIKEPE